MRSKDWIGLSQIALVVMICLVGAQNVRGQADKEQAEAQSEAQSDKGAGDLEAALEAKIEANSTKDLDAVVKLCESAIEKGLDDEGVKQASQLAASALFQHAEQLGRRIFDNGAQDARWRVYRSRALTRLKKAVKFQPDLGEAYLMIAKLNALPGGDKKQSREAVEKAVEFAGDDRQQLSSALFYRASLSEDQDAQLADLNQAIKINPGNIDAVRVRAFYYLRKQEPQNALADLQTWLDSDEQNSANYIVVVEQLMATGTKFNDELQQEALKIIDKAIEVDPENALPHTVRARINIVREDLDAAAADATRAVELDENSVSALMVRATILSEQEKLDDALNDINKVLELRPLLVDGIQMRGMILSQQQNFDGAIKDIKLLANNDRSNQFYQRQLAMLYNANEQPARAISIYERLLELNPAGAWEGKSAEKQILLMGRRIAALRGRGDAQLSTGEHVGAVESYDEAMVLGDATRELLKELSGSEDTSKPDDGILNNLAWVLATSPMDDVRDGKRAIELATLAAEVTEFKEAHILSTLASAYAETGDFDSAIKWIEKAVEVNRAVAEKAVDKTRTDKQQKSLQKELESYKKEEPWRELETVGKKDKGEDDKDKGKMKSEDAEQESEGESKGDEEDEKDEDEKDEDDEDNVSVNSDRSASR